MKIGGETGCFYDLQVSPHKLFIYYIWKDSYFTVEKSQGHNLPKWSKSMSPAMGPANSMQQRAQQHLDISLKNSGSNLIVRKGQSAKWRNALACDLWKWTGEQTQRLGNVPTKEAETWPPNAGVLLVGTPEWKIISSIYHKG